MGWALISGVGAVLAGCPAPVALHERRIDQLIEALRYE
jgi:hypothetical protein